MPQFQPIGYLFYVQEPGGLTRKLYATVADTIADAQMFVGNHLKITNQQIEFKIDGRRDRPAQAQAWRSQTILLTAA